MAVFAPFALALATGWASQPGSQSGAVGQPCSFRPSVRLPCPAGDMPDRSGRRKSHRRNHLSTTDDAPAPAPPTRHVSPVADPAPLGLAAFALTTFLLSAINAGWAKSSTGSDWWSYAIAYGGLGQLLAGMWEFRNRNVFGATAFSTYGGFWIGLGLWLHFIPATVRRHRSCLAEP